MEATRQKLHAQGSDVRTIEDQTRELAGNAGQFCSRSTKVKKRMWRKDMKYRMYIACGIVAVLLIVILPSG